MSTNFAFGGTRGGGGCFLLCVSCVVLYVCVQREQIARIGGGGEGGGRVVQYYNDMRRHTWWWVHSFAALWFFNVQDRFKERMALVVLFFFGLCFQGRLFIEEYEREAR